VFTDRQRQRLNHIVENADRIQGYVLDMSFEDFAANQMAIDAVERCLSKITEAAVRAGAETMDRVAPEVPLHVLRGFGNALRHDYDQIDLPTLWRTVQNDLPRLRDRCEKALEPAAD
jgi:uncharacterized protein with HEPN domain